jgi:hypothetical protein
MTAQRKNMSSMYLAECTRAVIVTHKYTAQVRKFILFSGRMFTSFGTKTANYLRVGIGYHFVHFFRGVAYPTLQSRNFLQDEVYGIFFPFAL